MFMETLLMEVLFTGSMRTTDAPIVLIIKRSMPDSLLRMHLGLHSMNSRVGLLQRQVQRWMFTINPFCFYTIIINSKRKKNKFHCEVDEYEECCTDLEPGQECNPKCERWRFLIGRDEMAIPAEMSLYYQVQKLPNESF